ncbi:MAG: cysteine dioxygenase family protein [Candidatus Xenobia bacterium]
MSVGTYDVRGMVEELTRNVAAEPDMGRKVQHTEAVLSRFLSAPLCIDGLTSHPDRYARHLLYRDPQDRFSVVAMVWGPGQSTSIHDHDGTWCVEGVFQGQLEITQFEMSGNPQQSCQMREGRVVHAGRGAVGNLIPPSEYHRIHNASSQTAISIHVYGREMMQCRRYVAAGNGSYRAEIVPLRYDSER